MRLKNLRNWPKQRWADTLHCNLTAIRLPRDQAHGRVKWWPRSRKVWPRSEELQQHNRMELRPIKKMWNTGSRLFYTIGLTYPRWPQPSTLMASLSRECSEQSECNKETMVAVIATPVWVLLLYFQFQGNDCHLVWVKWFVWESALAEFLISPIFTRLTDKKMFTATRKIKARTSFHKFCTQTAVAVCECGITNFKVFLHSIWAVLAQKKFLKLARLSTSIWFF